jgi:hypothetical protein
MAEEKIIAKHQFKVLVAMFGLNRFPKSTESSIIDNILMPLQRYFGVVDVVGHFNVPDIIVNPRGGEDSIKFVATGFENIVFEKAESERQSGTDSQALFDSLLSVPLYGEDDEGGTSRRNIGYQLSSLKKLSNLCIEHEKIYNLYVILRPDLIYHDPIKRSDIEKILKGKCDLIVPRWQSSGGINDRFCLANRAGAIVYMNRADELERFCLQHHFVHSERLLYQAVSKSQLRVRYMTMTASRVRTGGAVHAENFRDGWQQKAKRLLRQAKEIMLKR